MWLPLVLLAWMGEMGAGEGTRDWGGGIFPLPKCASGQWEGERRRAKPTALAPPLSPYRHPGTSSPMCTHQHQLPLHLHHLLLWPPSPSPACPSQLVIPSRAAVAALLMVPLVLWVAVVGAGAYLHAPLEQQEEVVREVDVAVGVEAGGGVAVGVKVVTVQHPLHDFDRWGGSCGAQLGCQWGVGGCL